MVGKWDPPKETQFKKGWKGGPGRPKGSLNLKNRTLAHLLKATKYPDLSKDPILSAGKPRMKECRGVVFDKILASMVNQALKGNTKAAELVVEWAGEKLLLDENDDPITEIKINIIKPDITNEN